MKIFNEMRTALRLMVMATILSSMDWMPVDVIRQGNGVTEVVQTKRIKKQIAI